MNHEFPTPESWEDPEVPEPPPERRGAPRTSRWRRLWGRLASALRRQARRPALDDDGELPLDDDEEWLSPPPLQMPQWLDVHEPSDDYTFETPALGDAFNFMIRVRCSWCVQATAYPEEMERKTAEVLDFIERGRPVIQYRIEEHVRPIARQFPPYRAAEAEAELSKQLSDCLSDGDVRVTARTRVDVCPPVREDLRKAWRRRLAADADGDMKKMYVELLGELREKWEGLLADGLEGMGAVPEARTSWLAPYALSLAEDPKHAAAYLKDVLDKRVGHAESLLADLGALAIDSRLEAVEFAFQSESALRALLVYLGVPIPSRDDAEAGVGSGAGGGADA